MEQDEKEQAFQAHAHTFAAHMSDGKPRTREDWQRYERMHAKERRQWKAGKKKEDKNGRG